MKIECSDVKSLASLWALEGESALEGRTLESLRSHLSGCSRCRNRYGSLTALIDLRDRAGVVPSPESPSLADRVMAGIPERKGIPSRRAIAFFPSSLPLAATAAALAVILFASGFIFGSRMRTEADPYVSVRFTLEAPAASSVGLVGYFPDSPVGERTPMTREGNGLWAVTVRLRRDGVYSYSFLIDGRDLLPDPSAEEWVDDGFGGRDSLLRL